MDYYYFWVVKYVVGCPLFYLKNRMKFLYKCQSQCLSLKGTVRKKKYFLFLIALLDFSPIKTEQGLRRTRKLRQCTNWKENLRICELAKASNKKNWSFQLVCPAGPSSWSVQLDRQVVFIWNLDQFAYSKIFLSVCSFFFSFCLLSRGGKFWN